MGNCIVTNAEQGVPSEMVSPYVEANFAGGISVGNGSCPGFDNEAVIKSFEFGMSNGTSAEIEILDEQGGAFEQSLAKLSTQICDYSGGDKMIKIRWGWTLANCDGSSGKQLTEWIYLNTQSVDITYAEGKVKYKMKCTDAFSAISTASRLQWTVGSDTEKLQLPKAMQELMDKDCPKIDINWVDKNGNSTGPFTYKDNPTSVWDADNQSKLSTALRWTEHFVTDQDRGTYLTWDHSKEKPTLQINESKESNCYKTVTKLNSAGTYVINGGKQSNVLSFSPTINIPGRWQQIAGVGGNTGGPLSPSGQVVDKCDPDPKKSGLGVQTSLTVTRPAYDTWLEKAPQMMAKNQKTNAEANAITGIKAIEAELKIQGSTDRRFWHPTLAQQQTVNIVFINPFHLRGGNCEWLAMPICNDYLTSGEWRITGLSHSIKEGSFVTTIKVMLPYPSKSDTKFAQMQWDKG